MSLWKKLSGRPDAELTKQLFEAACRSGVVETVKKLIAAGADVNAKGYDGATYGATALMASAKDVGPSGLDKVKALIAAGADVNAKGDDGTTALMKSAEKGYVNGVRALIAAGADVDAKSNDGTTALMFSVRIGYSSMEDRADALKALIAAGADVDAKSNDGTTALMESVKHGPKDFSLGVEALIAAGADVNARNNAGKTALDLASGYCHGLLRRAAEAPTVAKDRQKGPAQTAEGLADVDLFVLLGDQPIARATAVNFTFLRETAGGSIRLVDLYFENGITLWNVRIAGERIVTIPQKYKATKIEQVGVADAERHKAWPPMNEVDAWGKTRT